MYKIKNQGITTTLMALGLGFISINLQASSPADSKYSVEKKTEAEKELPQVHKIIVLAMKSLAQKAKNEFDKIDNSRDGKQIQEAFELGVSYCNGIIKLANESGIESYLKTANSYLELIDIHKLLETVSLTSNKCIAILIKKDQKALIPNIKLARDNFDEKYTTNTSLNLFELEHDDDYDSTQKNTQTKKMIHSETSAGNQDYAQFYSDSYFSNSTNNSNTDSQSNEDPYFNGGYETWQYTDTKNN